MLVLLLGGCTLGSDGPSPTHATPSDAGPSVTERQLLGTWGATPKTARGPNTPYIRFNYDGTFAGYDGCNSVGGTWALDPAPATVTAKVESSTLVGCPRNRVVSFTGMRVDGTALSYTVDGKTKTMQRRTETPATMFLVDNDTDQLVAVPAPIWPSLDVRTPRARTAAAIEALMAGEPMKGRTYSTYWGTFCRRGTGVKSIEQTSARVTVTLTGSGGALCDLSAEGHALQRQQLAWTVVENLGIDPRTPVRLMHGRDFRMWEEDVVADRAYLAPAIE
ncbi:hypothetical protein ASE12_11055 [Aeromicrobium sp. Root236]|nr:hypothetical protein ASE12_11055 [Aeromicrobium sp. Root236]